MACRRAARRWRRKAGQPQRAALALVLQWCEAGAERAAEARHTTGQCYRRACRDTDDAWWVYDDDGRRQLACYERARAATRAELACKEAHDHARSDYHHAVLLHDRLVPVCHGLLGRP